MTETRDLGGALVKFGSGAQVLGLEFPSDFSAVRVYNLPSRCDCKMIQEFLWSHGEWVELACIRIHSKNPAIPMADVKVQDPRFGERLLAKVNVERDQDRTAKFYVSLIQMESRSEASANRIQMRSVVCSWFKPSRIVYLQYKNRFLARDAVAGLGKNPNLCGRNVQVILQDDTYAYLHKGPPIHTVQILNVDINTPELQIWEWLHRDYRPVKVVLGRCSYHISDDQAQKTVRDTLRKVGRLDLWEVNTSASPTKVKATARFETPEAARAAVEKLDGTRIPLLGNSKLLLTHLVSVKFSILMAVFDAIQADLDQLKGQIWDAGHVGMKVYIPKEPWKELVVLRIYGEDARCVAQAKVAIESLLEGNLIMNGDSVAWHAFFAKPEGIQYLEQVQQENQAYIYRDTRKCQLRLFGSAENKENLRDIILRKIYDISTIIYLIPIGASLRGSVHAIFHRIVTAIGTEKVQLGVSEASAAITITGSKEDYDIALAMMDGRRATAKACVVCWTEPVKPIRTACGHIYCSDCFENQCAAVSTESNIPIRCQGDASTCQQIFTNEKLKSALPSTLYEALLETSLSIFVRTKPEEFQYCCTPDCEHVYRTSATGLVITCASCLALICSSCQVVAHDGLSCSQYQRIANAGSAEFHAWKRANNVKDCPKCKMAIEKTMGCNHMECMVCHAHICWVCMEVFEESGDVYAHMRAVHPEGEGY